MNQKNAAAQKLLYKCDFPAEILTGIPVIEIKGSAEAVVISHRGILAYDESEIRIATKLGPILIDGEALKIHRMNRERIVLHGTIRRVQLEREPC